MIYLFTGKKNLLSVHKESKKFGEGKIKYFIVLIPEVKKKTCLMTIIPVYCVFLGYD